MADPSVLIRRPQFWALQGLGWLVIQLVFFNMQMFLGTFLGAPVADVAWVVGGGTALAVVLASGLGFVLGGLPQAWLAPRRAVVIVVALSALASIPWTAGMAMLFRLCDWPLPLVQQFSVRFLAPEALVIFSWWSSLWLLTVYRDRIQREQHRALSAEALAHQAHLRALRAQLNPHFLFNSLNSLAVLIEDAPTEAKALIHHLAGLFRRMLHSAEAETTTVGEEIDFLRQYLHCESVRFRERLQVDIHVSSAVRDQPVPSMLLQPLIENAIRHGLGHSRRLELTVRARRIGRRLLFVVKNSGRLAATAATRLSAGPYPDPIWAASKCPPSSGRFGVNLVRQRLKVMYPASGRFSLQEEKGYVVARIEYEPDESVPAVSFSH